MIKKIKKTLARHTWQYRQRFLNSGRRTKVLEDLNNLHPVLVREAAVLSAKRLLISCIGPESGSIQTFLNYYRKLGVDHLLLVDGSGSSEMAAYLAKQEDCSVWTPKIDFNNANFGTQFYNALLHKYCMQKWAICVDQDELFVFPHMETRTLQDLISQLEDSDRTTLWAITIELYGPGPLSATDRDSPDLCYFDPSGYYQGYANHGQIKVAGGPRTRLLGYRKFQNPPSANLLHQFPETITEMLRAQKFEKPPSLQKIPLLKVDQDTFYGSRQQYLLQAKRNWPHKWHQCPTGVLLTYKYHRQFCENLLAGTSSNAVSAKSAVYSRLLRNKLRDNPEFGFMEDWSIPYESSLSLIDNGLMADGTALRPASRFCRACK